VVGLAHGLEVGIIEEEIMVAMVWLDMVDLSSLYFLFTTQTIHAPWIRFEMSSTHRPPPRTVV